MRYVSTLIAAAIALSWLAVSFAQAGHFVWFVRNQSLLAYGGVTAETLDQPWRVITSQFVHVYFLHAMFNALAVLAIGTLLERAIGWRKLVLAYLIGGSIGQIVAIAVMPDVVATGASQAAIGIAAASLVIGVRPRAIALGYILIAVVLDLVVAWSIKPPHVASLLAGVVVGA